VNPYGSHYPTLWADSHWICRQELQILLRETRIANKRRYILRQRRKYTRAKGKTASNKYNVAPDITRRGKKMPPEFPLIIMII